MSVPRQLADTDGRISSKKTSHIEIAIKITYVFWILGMMAYAFNISFMEKFAISLSDSVRWLGVCLTVPCFFLLSWSHKELGYFYSSKLELLDDHCLVKSGPYAWIRHPMYTTMIMLFVSASLISSNILVFIPNIVASILFYCRTFIEEKMLVERFKEQYIDYQKNTGRIFPKISGMYKY